MKPTPRLVRILLPFLLPAIGALAFGCGTQKPEEAFETFALAASEKPPQPDVEPTDTQPAPGPERAFRVFNGTGLVRSEWAPVGLPVEKGALQPSGSILIGTGRFAFKALERWNDGSVRRALIDFPAALGPYEEKRFLYQPTNKPPVGGFYPALPAGMLVEAIVNGTTVPFDSWTTLYTNATRWEGLAAEQVGTAASGLTLSLYSTAWTGQRFGRVVFVLGNDWPVRSSAASFPVSDVRVRFSGVYAAPLFGWAHGIQTVTAYQEFRLPVSGGVIGDGARWATAFTWADPSGPIEAAYASSLYPLFGYPEPPIEDWTRAYGLYGRVKRGVLTDKQGYFSRGHWETHRDFWLSNCPNSPWTGHGYWTQQEGSTGGHPDWSPAPTLPDDLALSPRGVHRMLQLSLSRSRTPDHYRIANWADPPQAGAFNGWVSPPRREQTDYNEHLSGSNGWSGSDDAHREENFRLRAYELTGDPLIYDELQQTGRMACLRAKPNGGYGEGRDMARTLQRKTIAWLTGNDADRAQVSSNLVPWATWLNTSFPSISTPDGTLYALSIIAPGSSKYGTHGFNPGGQSYVYFPFSESFVSGTLGMAAELTGVADLAPAAEKARSALARFCRDDGMIWDAILQDGTGRNPRGGNLWPYPGLSRYRGTSTRINAAAVAVENAYANSANFDEIGWLQP
jgi:hypothetical protein